MNHHQRDEARDGNQHPENGERAPREGQPHQRHPARSHGELGVAQPAVMGFVLRDRSAPFGQALRVEGAGIGGHETPLLSRAGGLGALPAAHAIRRIWSAAGGARYAAGRSAAGGARDAAGLKRCRWSTLCGQPEALPATRSDAAGLKRCRRTR